MSFSNWGLGAGRRGSRSFRIVAGGVATSVAVAGAALAGSPAAGAASAPNAQSVGRFLDGSVGGKPIQQLADLADARAVAPGAQSVQNPLDATVLGSLNVPLTGALQLPSLAGIHLGAVNQVAVAHTDGFSYGASGAVRNSGGASIGGDNSAFPASATIDLSAAALGGGTIPIPGGSSLPALGGLKATISGVAALAQTPVGVGKAGSTAYSIADVQLQLGSPALGGLLSGVTSQLGALDDLLKPVIDLLGKGLPAECQLTPGSLSTSITLASGAVVIDVAKATITLDVAKLLQVLKLDLNNLPPNTDLLGYVVKNLPTILSTGLGDLITGLVKPLTSGLSACLGKLTGVSASVLDPLTSGITALTSQLGSLLTTVTDGLAPLTDALGNVLAIGVNVQPNGPAGTFTSALKATPNQATGVVAGQTIVRAIEVKLFGGQVASLALANAAAGPSAAVAAVSTHATGAPASPNAQLPTGVPAGQASATPAPALPLVLLAIGVVMAGAGGLAWRFRGQHLR